MIFTNIHDTYQRVQRLEKSMNERLAKLGILDHIKRKTDENNIKIVQNKQAEILNKEENHHHYIEDGVRALEQHNRKLETEKKIT